MNENQKLGPINRREFFRGLGGAIIIVALCLYYYRDTSPTQKPDPKKQNTTGENPDSIVCDSAQNTIHYDTALMKVMKNLDFAIQPQRK